MKVLNIVAWILVVALLAGVGVLAFRGQQQSSQVAGLRDALAQVGTAAGIEGLVPEALQDPAKLPEILQQVQTAVQDTRMELAGAKDGLSAAQAEGATAKAEAATLSQKVQEQTTQAETLKKDLAAKDEAIAAAKAEAEKAVQEAKAAHEAAEQQQAALESSLEEVKAQMAAETARLQAELEAAQMPAVEAAAGAGAAMGAAVGADAAESMGMEETALPEPPPGEGRVFGRSRMFSLMRYSAEDQTLVLHLQDGQHLTYRDIPWEAYEELLNSGDGLDMKYRFRIQGTFKSIPPDSVVVRKFTKRQRFTAPMQDVRVVGPETPPAAAAPEAETTAGAPEAESAPEAEAPAEE